MAFLYERSGDIQKALDLYLEVDKKIFEIYLQILKCIYIFMKKKNERFSPVMWEKRYIR